MSQTNCGWFHCRASTCSCRSVCTYACVVVRPQWRSLPKEEQAIYYGHADRERRLHAQIFPEWSACENYVCTVYYAQIHVDMIFLLMMQHGHCRWYHPCLTCLSLCTGQKEEEDKEEGSYDGIFCHLNSPGSENHLKTFGCALFISFVPFFNKYTNVNI